MARARQAQENTRGLQLALAAREAYGGGTITEVHGAVMLVACQKGAGKRADGAKCEELRVVLFFLPVLGINRDSEYYRYFFSGFGL